MSDQNRHRSSAHYLVRDAAEEQPLPSFAAVRFQSDKVGLARLDLLEDRQGRLIVAEHARLHLQRPPP